MFILHFICFCFCFFTHNSKTFWVILEKSTPEIRLRSKLKGTSAVISFVLICTCSYLIYLSILNTPPEPSDAFIPYEIMGGYYGKGNQVIPGTTVPYGATFSLPGEGLLVHRPPDVLKHLPKDNDEGPMQSTLRTTKVTTCGSSIPSSTVWARPSRRSLSRTRPFPSTGACGPSKGAIVPSSTT